MHIRGQRRTVRIDSEREKLLGMTADGQPIWTTKGMFEMTGDQAHELSAALNAKGRFQAIQVIKIKVQEAAAGFFEQIILRTAPQPVVDSYQTDQPNLFLDWLVNSGYKLVQDGLTSIVLRNGAEIARTTAKVPAWAADEVLVALRVDQMVEKGSNGGH